ncbi:MAG: nitroreductase family protein [Deferribacteraceae bacterium]|jgi:nitroreductase|nr:nitroreductase family protein [Deferribacteraceae bacterium]
MKSILEAIQARRSINYFDPRRTIPQADLEKILDLAALAPSAYNSQPWEVYTVVTPEMKSKLRAACYNQAKIEEASAVFVIAGDLEGADKNSLQVSADMVRLGYFNDDHADKFRKAMSAGNGERGTTARAKFTTINVSLFAMNLMLAAQGIGYETHPMGGFDEEAVRKVLDMPAEQTAIIIVTIGFLRPDTTLLPRVYRRPAAEFNKFL